MTTCKKLIDDLLKKEGGFCDDPTDRGGITNFGITKVAYADYYNKPVTSITDDDIKGVNKVTAERIYLSNYYVRPKISVLPEQLRPLMLDMAVNHGVITAIKLLQQALAGFDYECVADGVIGSQTLGQATEALADHSGVFINHLVDLRSSLYHRIVNNNPAQARFIKGWLARAESFRVKALA
jgi:lysozyme family protein